DGPNVGSVAIQPRSRLDDPGVGLRNNGRRVLTYADLHTLGGPIDHRQAGRDIELHLTGHMERYVWSFNGQKFSEAEPLRFNHGERLRLVLGNDSMMNHPIHLHGMWGEVESEKGEFLVRKHTITVQPGQRLAYWVTADALGRWAYHCHLLYHMGAGMFREVHVASSSKAGARLGCLARRWLSFTVSWGSWPHHSHSLTGLRNWPLTPLAARRTAPRRLRLTLPPARTI